MNAQPEIKMVLGLPCVMIDRAAAHLNMKRRGLEDLIRRVRKNRKVRNFPCIQVGGPGSTRWFNLDMVDAWVAEKNGIELIKEENT